MIYGAVDGLITIVGAGSTPQELAKWVSEWENEASHRVTDPFEHLMNPMFHGFRESLHVFEHSSSADQDAFIKESDIHILPTIVRLRDRQEDMINVEAYDIYMDFDDKRTVAEINGLTEENDRWDKRTDEEKAKDLEIKKMMDKLREEGKLSEESFGPSGKAQDDDDEVDDNSGVKVRSANIRRNADGTIDVGNVLVTKDAAVDQPFIDAGNKSPYSDDKSGFITDNAKVSVTFHSGMKITVSAFWFNHKVIGGEFDNLVRQVFKSDEFAHELEDGPSVWHIQAMHLPLESEVKFDETNSFAAFTVKSYPT